MIFFCKCAGNTGEFCKSLIGKNSMRNTGDNIWTVFSVECDFDSMSGPVRPNIYKILAEDFGNDGDQDYGVALRTGL